MLINSGFRERVFLLCAIDSPCWCTLMKSCPLAAQTKLICSVWGQTVHAPFRHPNKHCGSIMCDTLWPLAWRDTTGCSNKKEDKTLRRDGLFPPWTHRSMVPPLTTTRLGAFCIHRATMHHVTSCSATYVKCMRV